MTQFYFLSTSVPQITKPATGSTWLVALKHLGVDDVQLVAQWSTRLIPFVMLILPFFIRADKWVVMALPQSISSVRLDARPGFGHRAGSSLMQNRAHRISSSGKCR